MNNQLWKIKKEKLNNTKEQFKNKVAKDGKPSQEDLEHFAQSVDEAVHHKYTHKDE